MDRRTRKLTSRELEVLHLVHLGLTNDEIAGRLGITSDGVKYHVSQILTKLGVSSRHEAVALAPSCAQALDVQTGDAPSTVYVLPPIEFPGPFGQAPGESQCNYERRQVALVDRIIGVIKFDDIVVQVRQDGYAESVQEMQSLLRHLLSR